MIIDCVCLSLSDDEEFIFAVWPSSPPLTNSAGAGCVLGRPVGVCSAPTRNTSAHVHTLIDCCATLDIHYNIIQFLFLFPTDILRFACVDVPVCVCRVQPEVDRKFPPSKEKKKRGPLLVAANRSSHPTVLAVRSLLLMTEAKGGRKKTIGCSLCAHPTNF